MEPQRDGVIYEPSVRLLPQGSDWLTGQDGEAEALVQCWKCRRTETIRAKTRKKLEAYIRGAGCSTCRSEVEILRINGVPQ